MEAGICQILRGTDGATDSTAWSRNCQVNSKQMPTKSSLTYAFAKSKLKLNADFFQRPQYAKFYTRDICILHINQKYADHGAMETISTTPFCLLDPLMGHDHEFVIVFD